MNIRSSESSKTIGQLVAERPERGRLFERLGIDYCCGGRKSLDQACAQRGLDADHVRAQLDAADAAPTEQAGPDWTTAPLTQLADHIEATHHRLMRDELPRAAALVSKVAKAHGQKRPELLELQRTFALFSQELLSHMSREDTVLFPWIRSLESPGTPGSAPGVLLDAAIRRMMHEHDDAGEALASMRALTNGFTPPEDACGTYRVMLSALGEIEADMHLHVHKENNVLFPRALALKASR